MSWRLTDWEGPAIVEGSPGDAVPGDELVWVTDEPGGPVHHALEVGLVVHTPRDDHVRVLSRDGTEHTFRSDRVVVLLRDLQELLDRSRASDQPGAAQGHHASPGPLAAGPDA